MRFGIAIALLLALAMPSLGQQERHQGPPPGQGPGQRNHGQHAGDWLRKHRDLPPDQQEKALRNDPEFQKLPPERQQRLLERLHKFNGLTPEEQNRRLSLMDKLQHMTPEQRQHARATMESFRNLPPERKQALRDAVHQLVGMTPEQRDETLNSPQFKQQFSDQERGIMKDVLQLGVGPAFQPENAPGTPPQ